MLGIRLRPEEEDRLERHARTLGRPKSAIVREWIVDRLEQDSVDEMIRHAAMLHASSADDDSQDRAVALSQAQLQWLDAEDGGYDWGPEGPPPVL